jgi:hypothetical protein
MAMSNHLWLTPNKLSHKRLKATIGRLFCFYSNRKSPMMGSRFIFPFPALMTPMIENIIAATYTKPLIIPSNGRNGI